MYDVNLLFFCCFILLLDATGPTIVTTIVPLGPGPTHTICPHCHAEIETATKTEPGMIAYISGVVIALLGLVEDIFFFFLYIKFNLLINFILWYIISDVSSVAA